MLKLILNLKSFTMYDTVKIIGYSTTPYDAEEMLFHTDWSVYNREVQQVNSRFDPQTGQQFETADKTRPIMWCHNETGLRLMGHRIEDCEELNPDKPTLAIMREAEFALPRQIFETNGSLLTDQAEVDLALSRAMKLILSVCPDFQVSHFSRLDMVWQFQTDCYKAMNELKRIKHPQIRKTTTEYNHGESLIWRGKDRKIRAYDKTKEMTNRKGDVLRVEVQLNGRALVTDVLRNLTQKNTKQREPVSIGADKDQFHYTQDDAEAVVLDGKIRTLPSLDTGYRTYRDILAKFEPTFIPKFSNFYGFLAHLNHDGTTMKSGQNCVDVYLGSLSPTSRPRVLRKIKEQRAQFTEFSFRKLLPTFHPPAPVHIHQTKREVSFEARPQQRRSIVGSRWSTA